MASTSSQQGRYYFGCLKVRPVQVSLSMITASELAPDLKIIKKSLGVPLIKFEDAKIELGEFCSIASVYCSLFAG
jgi:vacuolar protein sorting-associated protein 13D